MNLDIIDKNIVACAKRNSGKSVLIKYLIECNKDKFSKIYIVCPTNSINQYYNSITDEDCIMDDYNEEWTELLIKKLSKVNANKPKTEMKRCCLVLDDVACDANFHQSKSLKI
jgi:predicted AAA+ superfamily ATPase